MIEHINPFYTVAGICAIACVLVLLIGVVITDWEMIYLRWKGKQIARRREERPEWADPDKWEESR